ncbi:MAG: LytTR family DNA-binding domain-containing protein [Ferruginibacter sp.]
MNCLVIDDEQHAIEVLEHYIKQTPSLRLAGSANNPAEAISILQKENIELIFLDIHMPQLSGLDFIRSLPRKYPVILCTAYTDHAVEGFDLDVTDYLVKPIPFARFLKAVQKAQGNNVAGPAVVNPETKDFILVKTGTRGSLLKINVQDISMLEAQKNYTAIYHHTEKTLSLTSMKDMEEKLPAGDFIRVHKSFIISLAHVKQIEGNTIIMRHNNMQVPLGEAYRQSFLEILKSRLVSR